MQNPRWPTRAYLNLRNAAFSCARSVEDVEQWIFDRRYGVSTRGIVYTNDSLTATGGDNLFYDNCGWLPVRRALKDIDVRPAHTFVDLGSGKGQILLIAAQLPFRRVVGVELNEEFSRCAQRNVERASPRLRVPEVETVTANVLEWPIPDDTSVIFMFNPFIGQTYRTVMHRVFESYDRQPRDLHIVYAVPWEHNWLLSTGRVAVTGVRPWRWPAFPRWWRRGLVIVSYRVTGAAEGAPDTTGLPRGTWRRRPAFSYWASQNDFCFAVSQPGRDTVFSRSG